MKRLFTLTYLLIAIAASGCGPSEPRDPLLAALESGKAAEEKQQEKLAATHSDDPNPLRRKLSDLQIRELFFGPDQIDGDWMAWMPCSQAKAGLPVQASAKVYLSSCDALTTDLLAKARAEGFSDVSADDVLDPRLTGAKKP